MAAMHASSTQSGSGRRPVSSFGGSQPRFTKNGREIVYRRGGARFLLSVPVARPGATPRVVVTNWFDELRRKVPQ